MKRGNTDVPMYMSVARFTYAAPLLLLSRRCCTARMCLEFRGSVDWNLLFPVDMCSRWHAHILRTRAHTEAPFVAVAKQVLKIRLLLFRGCHSVKIVWCHADTRQQTASEI